MTGRPSAAHHHGDYQRRAADVRRKAYADATTRCWRCERTLAEHQRTWTAGHVHDGDARPGAPLRPECDECRAKSGAIAGNKRRIGLDGQQNW